MQATVLIVTYNHAKFVARALESVLAQRTDFNFNVVVADDCSTDGTAEIIRRVSAADSVRRPGRIVPLLRPRNLGSNQNFDSAFDSCTGEYLAFLEGDDFWNDEQKLATQVQYLSAHPRCVLSCHRVHLLTEDCDPPAIFPDAPAGEYTLEDLLREENFIATGSVVCRRRCIQPFPPALRHVWPADLARWSLAAAQGTITLHDEVMGTYRLHPTGLWTARPQRERLRMCCTTLRALDRQLDFRYTRTIKRRVATYEFEGADLARRERRRRAMLRCLWGCLRAGGWSVPAYRSSMAASLGYGLFGAIWDRTASMRRAVWSGRA